MLWTITSMINPGIKPAGLHIEAFISYLKNVELNPLVLYRSISIQTCI